MTAGPIATGVRALVSGLDAPETFPSTGGSSRSGFAERLGALLTEADRAQQDAETQARALAEGEGDTVETMLALSRAELSLQLVTQVRDRALEAYQEIMRLQV